MTWLGWKDVLLRFVGNIADNRLMSLAGAVAFFTLLSLVPALSLFVTIYRYFTDPLTIAAQLDSLTIVFPDAARDLIREQAIRLATQGASALSLTFLVSFVVAAWSANAAVKAVFDALNIIYREREKRSFIKLNAISLMTTICGVIMLALALDRDRDRARHHGAVSLRVRAGTAGQAGALAGLLRRRHDGDRLALLDRPEPRAGRASPG